jgi:hypothetical protein
MLHDPRPRRRGQNPLRPLLSVTADTLPVGTDFVCRRVRRADHPSWYLIVVRDGVTYGELARAYTGGRLPEWVRARMWVPLGVADPATDLVGYHRTRWWDEEWATSHTTAHLLEDAAGPDLLTPWHHDWLLNPPA